MIESKKLFKIQTDNRLGVEALFYFMDKKTLSLIQLLIARLERISADSIWAHRASGIRGALLHISDQVETEIPSDSRQSLELMIKKGFNILEKAARK